MGRRAARATHLALSLLGAVLFFVFVIPRWWVLTGDLPVTLATVGRIAAGLPIAAAAVPVALVLQDSLKPEVRAPEPALRLRAWSAVLHLVSGVLIIATAVVEIWLSLQSAGPWLFGIYGGAGAVGVLAAVAFALSFTAEKPPKPPKPAKAPKPPKTAGSPKATEAAVAAQDSAAKPARKRRTRKARSEEAAPVVVADTEADDPGEAEAIAAPESNASEPSVEPEPVDAAEPPIEPEPPAGQEPITQEQSEKRPTGKNRHRLRR